MLKTPFKAPSSPCTPPSNRSAWISRVWSLSSCSSQSAQTPSPGAELGSSELRNEEVVRSSVSRAHLHSPAIGAVSEAVESVSEAPRAVSKSQAASRAQNNEATTRPRLQHLEQGAHEAHSKPAMVYQIFSDGIDRRLSLERANFAQDKQRQQRRNTSARVTPHWLLNPNSSQFYANLLIALIKSLLILYDIVTLPVYFVLQRPDRRRQRVKQLKSQQVDANTWVGVGQRASDWEANLNKKKSRRNEEDATTQRRKFMGSTTSEIFANAIREFDSRPCLGYRALVTCPIITLDEQGRHIFKDQSFRSDFTWYTYGQIGRRVQDLASGLYFNAILPSTRAMFMASSCLEWFCVAQACFQLSIQLVLWPESNNDPRTMHSIVMQAQVETLFVSCDQLNKLCLYLKHAHTDPDSISSTCLKKIIIIDWQFAVDFNEFLFVELGQRLKEAAKLMNKRCPAVLSIGQMEEAGIENPIELSCSRALSDESLNSAILAQDTTKPEAANGAQAAGSSGSTQAAAEELREKRHEPFAANSRWTIGGEPIVAPAPCMSAPTRRKQPTGSGAKQIIDGNNKHLQASLLNSYRNANNRSPTLPASLLNKAKPQDLALIVYTFGSLGELKAIALTHEQLARSNHELFLDGLIGAGDTHCAVLPLDCLIELMSELRVFAHGGPIGYSNNLNTLFYDGKELFERDKSDLEAAAPTYLLLRPYIIEQLRVSLQSYLQLRLNPILSLLFKNVLYDYKSFWARRHFETPLVDRLFCSRLRRFFGQRMQFILCNGTTDSSETRDFFAFMVNLPIIELYGPDEAVATMLSAPDNSNEQHAKAGRERLVTRHDSLDDRKQAVQGKQTACAGAQNQNQDQDDDDEEDEEDLKDLCDMQLLPPKVNRNVYRENKSKNILISSSIFSPTGGTRIRLEDWAEFRLSDSPFPRGRLVIGGKPVCKGYLDQRDLLAPCDHASGQQFFGWFRTGDIARAFPDGSFEIISAISIIKMADGQLVSLSQIEHTLKSNQFVDNVCALCGGDDGSFVINLVVPNLRRIALKSPNEANLKMAIGMETEPDELIDVEFRREVCNDRLLCEFVTDHLKKLLSKSGLGGIKNRFLLVPEIWTPESELVTAAFEPKREAIQKFYANDIQSLVRIQTRERSRRLSDNRRHKSVIQWLR